MTSHDGSSLEVEHDGTTVALGGPVVTVGRSKDATLRVIHPLVSRLHCRLEIGEEGVFVCDLQSVNGTHVNGVAVKTPVRLVRGDAITLGKEGALLHVLRAEMNGRDLLDPDAGDQATMLVGDPRARDIAARIELGAGAGEQNTAEVAPTPRASPTPPAAPTTSPAAPKPSAAPVAPRPPGPPPPPKPVSATPHAPAARPAAPKPPGPPPRPRDVAPPPPPPPRPQEPSGDTISLVPLPDLTEETPLADDDVPELPDHTIPVDAPHTMPYAAAPLDRTLPADAPLDRTAPAPAQPAAPVAPSAPVDRTIEADPSPPKDIYTVMPLASAVLGSAETSPIPAATLRRVRELAAEREAAARAEQAGHAPPSSPPTAKPRGLVPGLLAGLATGVAIAYGISLLLARSGT